MCILRDLRYIFVKESEIRYETEDVTPEKDGKEYLERNKRGDIFYLTFYFLGAEDILRSLHMSYKTSMF